MNRFVSLRLFAALGLAMSAAFASAQCADGELSITIGIQPDSWPNETSWELMSGDVILAEGGGGTNGVLEETVVCFDASIPEPCLEFYIHDSYGDGIYSPGGYWISIDGEEVASGNNFGYGEAAFFLCPEGSTCTDAGELSEADYGWVDQTSDNYWYTFTPPQNGMYLFSTCEAACNTQLWIYDYCNMNNFDDTNEGSIYYDDSEGGCGESASLTVLLEGGVTYWVRMASLDGSCGGEFAWEFDFVGPPTGCMDEAACNYSPLAEVDSGECIYPGDPDCTGPDLIVLESAISNSLSAATLEVGQGDCYVGEGCLNGYGTRELVRFTTHIKNIGDVDYYIGPTSQNGTTQQFEWGDCHNHFHYKGYAEYILFEMDGTALPIGFKNGFCVMDLECSDGGTAQYGCSNMGISAHCGDIYGSGLSCQWIDVTDIPDGQYQLVVRVNWDESPDALGRYEISYDNNWAVVCIGIDRSSGALVVEEFEDCAEYTDCTGEVFGLAQPDCNGECNGSALMGDLDANGAQEYSDAVSYVEHILGNDIEAEPCTDIDQDGEITVTDAALMSQCQFFNVAHEHPDSSGFHDKCQFPVVEITNPFDTVHFAIGNVNLSEGFLDVHVLNPNNRIVGYEFIMSGMGIASAVSIADPIEYPIEPAFMPGGSKVIGLSYQGESFKKNYEWVPLVRLYWSNASDEICIESIVDVVNDQYENTLHVIAEGCVVTTGVSEAVASAPIVYPNPMTDEALIRFENPARQPVTIDVLDARGRVVRSSVTSGTQHRIVRSDLEAGSYMVRLTSGNIQPTLVRLSIQ